MDEQAIAFFFEARCAHARASAAGRCRKARACEYMGVLRKIVGSGVADVMLEGRVERDHFHQVG